MAGPEGAPGLESLDCIFCYPPQTHLGFAWALHHKPALRVVSVWSPMKVPSGDLLLGMFTKMLNSQLQWRGHPPWVRKAGTVCPGRDSWKGVLTPRENLLLGTHDLQEEALPHHALHASWGTVLLLGGSVWKSLPEYSDSKGYEEWERSTCNWATQGCFL